MTVSRAWLKNPWVRGAAGGLAVSAVVALLSITDVAEGTPLQRALQIFGTLPVYAAMKFLPDWPECVPIIVYFLYWVLLGALVGWGLSRGRAGKLIVFLGLVLLGVGHYLADAAMQKEIEGAVRALVEWLRF